MGRECQESFPNEAGKGTLISSYKAETGLLWMLEGPSVFLSSGGEYVGNFLSCTKVLKDRLEAEQRRCDLP